MKNIVKKLSAVAMAFALLGAGSTIASNVSSKPTILTASAACQYHRADNTYKDTNTRYRCSYGCYHYAYRCKCCNQIMFYK